MNTIDKYLTDAKKPAELGGLSPHVRKTMKTADDAIKNLLQTFEKDIKRTNFGQKGEFYDTEKKLLSDLKQTSINWSRTWSNFVRLARDIETGY